jgi:TM2 domain-containing membrane protein YozV
VKSPSDTRSASIPWPFAAILAWALPGLGHFIIGQKRRGIIIGSTLISLFIAGLLIGSIDVVDSRRDTLWFAGQAMLGPIAIAVDFLHASLDASGIPHPPTEISSPIYFTSIGRVNELGTLYCTLAGVLNLLAILDVVGRLTHIPAADELPTDAPAGRLLTRDQNPS